ncbi:hypothetical protein [Actinokineospora enzanensis]|uniref:hypothetical protein n=1 Tax=Actinokineospora enzanensis TaxID=155975 RepID=UPI0003657BB4|nr:hypothetical protein [Actinokineospora enzanensis]
MAHDIFDRWAVPKVETYKTILAHLYGSAADSLDGVEPLKEAARAVFGPDGPLKVVDDPAEVWQLDWWDGPAHFRELHLTKDEALASLAADVRGRWATAVAAGNRVPAEPPVEVTEMIETFFRARRNHGERFELSALPLGTTMVPVAEQVGRATLRALAEDPDTDGTEPYVVDAFGTSTTVKDTPAGDFHVHVDAEEHIDRPVHVVVRGHRADGTFAEQHHTFLADVTPPQLEQQHGGAETNFEVTKRRADTMVLVGEQLVAWSPSLPSPRCWTLVGSEKPSWWRAAVEHLDEYQAAGMLEPTTVQVYDCRDADDFVLVAKSDLGREQWAQWRRDARRREEEDIDDGGHRGHDNEVGREQHRVLPSD